MASNSEGEDAVLTVAAIVIVALVAAVLGRRFASPWLELQDARLCQALDHEWTLRIELERELDVRQTVIEQANHHLRTPVTVVYGMPVGFSRRACRLTSSPTDPLPTRRSSGGSTGHRPSSPYPRTWSDWYRRYRRLPFLGHVG